MPEHGFAEPEAPTGGGAYTVCYTPFVPAVPDYIVQHLNEKLRRTLWTADFYEGGKVSLHSGAVMGNKVYAYRREQRFEALMENFLDSEKTLFVTLTGAYEKTEKGRRDSWQKVQKELPMYVRKLRQAGMVDYIAVKEAHADGGCHVHLLAKWDTPLKTVNRKGKLRITNRKIVTVLKNNWYGWVDVQAVKDDGVRGYVKKELGKFAHIEAAVRRAKRGWGREGDEPHRKRDIQRLYTVYYADVLHIRLYNASRGTNREPGTDTADCVGGVADTVGGTAAIDGGGDLIMKMNNTTANKPKKVWSVVLTKEFCRRQDFMPFNGAVDPQSSLYQGLMALYKTLNPRPL